MAFNPPLPSMIEAVRESSRRLVRELGFMGGNFAGTDLPPSAVHALLEIDQNRITARELAEILRLEKSSVSRLLRKLVIGGDVAEEPTENDMRAKLLSLTPAGRKRVAAIHAYARDQVSIALDRLDLGQDRVVLEGLRLYAGALAASQERRRPRGIDVVEGYRPGILARITQMHALYYAETCGFGQVFESIVAGGLAEFAGRLQKPENQLWAAVCDGQILGSIAIDGEHMGPGVAHLRWFIVDDLLKGFGVGKRLLDAALAFADDYGFEEIHLWTFAGLDAARHLYEAKDFILAQETGGTQWGKEVLEQRFVRRRP